jgi:hypothetical protein
VFSAIAGLTLIICYPIILFFHKRLIKLTTGEIKKRLRLIIIGVILCFVSHFIGGYTPSYVLLRAYSDFLQIISAPIFIVGLAIIFLGVYKFPAFLEFGWREYLVNFYIVNKTNYKILYTYDFKDINSKSIKSQPIRNSLEEKELFFSRGIIGIDTILSVISNSTPEVNKGLQQIKQGDFLILLNYGDKSLSHIIFCLLVKKEMKSLFYFNKKAKDEFQKIYSPILSTINQLDYYELNIFSGFDKVLKQMLK